MSFTLLMQEFEDLKNAESGTNTTTLKITSHGLSTGDMIVNTTQRVNGIFKSSIVTRVDANTLTTRTITGQTINDVIVLFKFVDRTAYLKSGSLNLTINNRRENSLSGTLIIDLDQDVVPDKLFFPKCGRNIKLLEGLNLLFGGTIQNVNIRRIGKANSTIIEMDFSSDGFNHIPSRRTVADEFLEQLAGTIVGFQIDTYLDDEGITEGTIIDGAFIDEYPEVDSPAKNIKEILDDMANSSGCYWYIDADRRLHFVETESMTDALENITDAGLFKDFWNVEITEDLEDYRNRQFVKGGVDEDGDIVLTFSTDYDEVFDRQLTEGGSGVYGNIIENSNITAFTELTCDTGTNTTTIVTTIAHGLVKGDMIVNKTRNEKREVLTVVNSTTFTVYAVTGQTTGDLLKFYPDANNIMRTLLKTHARPKKAKFTTSNLDYRPNQKIIIDLAQLGADNEECLIESVNFYDVNGKYLQSDVFCVQRDHDGIISRPIEGWEEYFKKFLTKEQLGEQIFATPTEPTNKRVLWLDTGG